MKVKTRIVTIGTMFALLLLTLVAVPQAFAQSDNACHADNPLHNTYYANRDCTTEAEWKVGWCLHKVYNEGWEFRLYGIQEDGSPTEWYNVLQDEYNGSMCEFMHASYSYDAQPKWIQEIIDYQSSFLGLSRDYFEIAIVRPDPYHNTRAAAWDAQGFNWWINRKMAFLHPPS